MTIHQFFKEYHHNELARMIFISLCAHIFVLILIFTTPSFPPPKLTFGPVYTVHLVSFSESFTQSREAQSFLNDLSRSTDHVNTSVLKKGFDIPSAPPIKRIEDNKVLSNRVENVIDELRKKVASSVPSSDKKSNGGRDDGMREYYTLIWSRIRNMWTLPPDILPRKDIEAVIHVTIARNGNVVDMYFEKRSGNEQFDESTVRAIRKASPFPPLPEGVGRSSIEVGIRFHPSRLKEKP